ncbi:hypothetical protein GALMADRAFT_220000 [Galerina marginata CBS 339.88]|uniref:DUF6534 domain-containing protein n=1 Tax=Galerina marginata (strain CBS 339.88) TaxID=685588 RepID=A0A067TYN7_GALM3|nr:hypothetical protein GALMADRAFT_220000 [Galerina marginata CBS 339.88]
MSFLDNIFGAAALGTVFNGWLVGLVCVFAYRYYVNFPKDGLATKLLVRLSIIQSKMVYYYLVTSFGISDRLSVAIWEWALYLGLISLSSIGVQIFYAHRIFLLSKSYALAGLILVFAFSGVGFCMAIMTIVLRVKAFEEITYYTWMFITWLSFATACDVTIAIYQVTYLRRHRTRVRRTNRVINTLILYIMSTGLLTSMTVIVELSTFVAIGFNFGHVFLSYQMASLHAVSFLATLDSRRAVRDMIGPEMLSITGTVDSEPVTFDIKRVEGSESHSSAGTAKTISTSVGRSMFASNSAINSFETV